MRDYKTFLKADEESDLMKKIDKIEGLYEDGTQALSNLTGNFIKDYNLWSKFGKADDKTAIYFGDIVNLMGLTNELVKTTFEYGKEEAKTIEAMDKKIDKLNDEIKGLEKMIEAQSDLIKTLKNKIKE
jgi:prefoldin subunit 5